MQSHSATIPIFIAGPLYSRARTNSAFPPTGSFAQNITMLGRAWPLDVATITCEMRVYHGEQDTLVPVSHGRHTTEMIDGSTLAVFPEHRHLSMITELPRAVTEFGGAF